MRGHAVKPTCCSKISEFNFSGNAVEFGAAAERVDVTVLLLAMIFAGIPGLSNLGGLPLLLIMFVAMYFLLIAPNQKKQKQWQAMLSQIKAGDRITSNGGLRGTVVSVRDDVLVVRTAPDGVKLEMVKSAIAAVTTDDAVKS